MALARTNVIQATFGTAVGHGTGAATTGSFTPPDNSLLVVRMSATQETDGGVEGSSFTIADSAGLTWTHRISTTVSPGWSFGESVWTAPVTTGVSMTVSGDCGASNLHGVRIEVFAYTDYDTIKPTGVSAFGTDADGNNALQIVLSDVPETTSEVLAFVHVSVSAAGTRNVSPDGAWTELFDAGIDGWMNCQSQVRSGSASRNVDWTDLQAGTAPVTGATAIALEIRQSVAPTNVAWLTA